jgi:hypothetical protein
VIGQLPITVLQKRAQKQKRQHLESLPQNNLTGLLSSQMTGSISKPAFLELLNAAAPNSEIRNKFQLKLNHLLQPVIHNTSNKQFTP